MRLLEEMRMKMEGNRATVRYYLRKLLEEMKMKMV
jgi:predicted transcriptional regulator